ncbi:PrpF family protein [Rhodobacteraceae bacterium RKSG542]|uniref:2-methylaconitate cis-trans isomerase PrpF family protein n=1 Tax=Pseudovibrio flavus TaxID=2529854 RepID=UPI0012BD80CD|nr:PrpF domain-containing protein [Pseudovibrio flavus]MTI17521.1 PrpF family protein [Pseudovibrio flavus]
MASKIKAVFARGGTSKAVVFNKADLPKDRREWDHIFLSVLGSPDPYGRQLDGMGGGISSLSKVVIVEPSMREDADIDYTFVQIAVGEPVADYGAMCGNMASCVGPFAVEEKIVPCEDGLVSLRIHNTNTSKTFSAHFEVRDGNVIEEGDFTIPGVTGSGAEIRLDFHDPGGAKTGKLLPTGNAKDTLEVAGMGSVEASMVDASNPVVFVKASDLGADCRALPQVLDADTILMDKLERIRKAASVAMGISNTEEDALLSNPKVAIVSQPEDFTALDGSGQHAQDFDVAVRLVSMGNFHRAITLTGAMCVAVAAKVNGTLLADIAGNTDQLRIGNPSGILPVSALVSENEGKPYAVSATTYRTQRRLMEGHVLVPQTKLVECA